MARRFFSQRAALLMMMVTGLGFAQAFVDADAQSLLSAFVSYTDLRIRSVQQCAEILASTTEARSGRWENMRGLLSDYQKTDDGLVVWFSRPDGSYYTVEKGLMDVRLSDRSYFPELVAGRKVVGALVVSKSTGQRSAVVAIPMTASGKIVGAIGASLFLDKLSEQVASTLALPPDASFFALAPDGLTALHRKADRHFLDPRELGSETLKKAANEMLSKTSGETTYEFDNVTKKAIYRTSPRTQWRFAIAFDAAPRK
ncbi:MAG: cache domain-containing protein [Acidobacteriota bacterium]